MGKVLTRFPLVEEMLVLATLPPDAPADAKRLTDFADRLTSTAAALRGEDGQPLVQAVRYRPDAEMFDFVQHVVVPNGLAYLDDGAYAEAMRRLTAPRGWTSSSHAARQCCGAGPGGAGLGKALIRDPLRLHEFLLSQVGRLAPGGMKFAPGDAAQPGRAPFVSPDGRSLLIRIAGTQPPSRLEFCREIVDAVTHATRDVNDGKLDVKIAGAYAVAAHNAAAIRHDAILGVNGSVVGILILFALLYRRPLRLFTFAVRADGSRHRVGLRPLRGDPRRLRRWPPSSAGRWRASASTTSSSSSRMPRGAPAMTASWKSSGRSRRCGRRC